MNITQMQWYNFHQQISENSGDGGELDVSPMMTSTPADKEKRTTECGESSSSILSDLGDFLEMDTTDTVSSYLLLMQHKIFIYVLKM